MIGVGLYSCSAVERPSLSPSASLPCSGLFFFFLGFGTGVINSERRRPCTGGTSIGWPSLSKAWWSLGTSYGELRIGLSKKVSVISPALPATRSEEHTSELQSLTNLVCRLLL